jgi:hypothetical protein
MNTPIKPAAARASDISTTVGPNKGPDIDRQKASEPAPVDWAKLAERLRQVAVEALAEAKRLEAL